MNCLSCLFTPFRARDPTPGTPRGPALRPGGARSSMFLLVEALGSTASAAFASRSARRRVRFVRRLPCYYSLVRLPEPYIGPTGHGPWRALRKSMVPETIGSPSSAHEVSMHAEGLRPRRISRALAYRAPECCLPLRLTASAVRESLFRGSMARLHFPLSTLRDCPRGQPRMTRGRDDWPGLSRMTLSFTSSCRLSDVSKRHANHP